MMPLVLALLALLLPSAYPASTAHLVGHVRAMDTGGMPPGPPPCN